jgi:hypothetical protein
MYNPIFVVHTIQFQIILIEEAQTMLNQHAPNDTTLIFQKQHSNFATRIERLIVHTCSSTIINHVSLSLTLETFDFDHNLLILHIGFIPTKIELWFLGFTMPNLHNISAI